MALPPLDRNATTPDRIRRNWQKFRNGGANAALTLVEGGGIENTDDGLQITVVFNETPAGTINGTNAVFTLAHQPVTGTLMLFVSGVLMLEGGDFSVAGTSVTFVPAAKPETGDWIRATYLR